MLRRKNHLMRAGRTDEAGALAARIRTVITRSSTRWMRDVNNNNNNDDRLTALDPGQPG